MLRSSIDVLIIEIAAMKELLERPPCSVVHRPGYVDHMRVCIRQKQDELRYLLTQRKEAAEMLLRRANGVGTTDLGLEVTQRKS